MKEKDAPQGAGPTLPPDVQAMAERMNTPEWKAELTRLEGEVHKALDALFAFTNGAAACSIPHEMPNGKLRAVVAGEPLAVIAALTSEGPRLIRNRHVIVGTPNPAEFLLGALMNMMKEAQEDEDDRCDDPECEACNKTH